MGVSTFEERLDERERLASGISYLVALLYLAFRDHDTTDPPAFFIQSIESGMKRAFMHENVLAEVDLETEITELRETYSEVRGKSTRRR